MDALPRREIELEIVTRVAEAVARFGVAGDVRIVGENLVLEGYGPTASAPLGTLPDDWHALAPELRMRRCTELARRLVSARRGSTSVAPPARRALAPSWLAPLAIAAAATAGLYAVWHVLSPPESVPDAPLVRAPANPASSAALIERARVERATRVCNEARARVLRGATLGPTDVEGWVVEIGLLRPGTSPDLVFDPGLSTFVDRPPGKRSGRFVWPGAPDVSALAGPDTAVELADASVPDARAPEWRGLTLTFTGRYAAPYFNASERQQFVRIAATLAERLGATYAGLYARCAAGTTHDVGAWFEGPGPGGAVSAMLYFIGLYAVPPQRLDAWLDADASADGRAGALAHIADATRALARDRAATLLGTYGGMIAGRADGPGYVTFPFADSNRAARASRGIADALSAAPKR